VTRDVDFTGLGDASQDHLISVFSQIMSKPADDGLVYDIDRLTAEAIREEQQYGGTRLKTIANLGKTRIPIVIDIGFVDVVNRLGGNCFGCHVKAEPQYDMICERDHGCDAIPVTREAIAEIQQADPRCIE
jgi:hypothetical protein